MCVVAMAVQLLLMLVLVHAAIVASLFPWERQTRNQLIQHYTSQQSYPALEILNLLICLHGYVLR